MKREKKKKENRDQHHENPLPGEINSGQKHQNMNALKQADKDISGDAELSAHNKNDDLDEGELGRLGEDKTDLV